jgi:two-component system response regulator YesN
MRTIVIAEDEDLFRKELAAATPWESLGFVLAGEAADGEDAWSLIVDRRPDAVLADIRMPRLDGIGLLDRLEKELPPQERPFVVLITGHSEFEYARSALRFGAFDYLLKPLDDAEFSSAMAALRSAVDERRRSLSRSLALEGASRTDSALAFFSEYAPSDGPRDASDLYVERAVAEIVDLYVTDLGADDVARKLGITGGHLSRIFKQRTGSTFGEYLVRYRMKRAAELLRDPSVHVGEVADLVGYRDQRYFSSLFRRLVGVTPTQFREGKFAPDEPAQGT